MPKYYCVRKSHNSGWKHKEAVYAYYRSLSAEQRQSIIDELVKTHSRNAATSGQSPYGVGAGGGSTGWSAGAGPRMPPSTMPPGAFPQYGAPPHGRPSFAPGNGMPPMPPPGFPPASNGAVPHLMPPLQNPPYPPRPANHAASPVSGGGKMDEEYIPPPLP